MISKNFERAITYTPFLKMKIQQFYTEYKLPLTLLTARTILIVFVFGLSQPGNAAKSNHRSLTFNFQTMEDGLEVCRFIQKIS